MSATFQPDGAPPARSGSSTVKIVLVVLAVLVVLGLLACGGLALLAYLGLNQAQEAIGEQVRRQLENNPVVVEELGELDTLRLNLMETSQRDAENPGSGNYWVLDAVGSKASGKIVGPANAGGQLISATLELEDGRNIEIPLEEPADDSALDFDPDLDADPGIEQESGLEEEPAFDEDAAVLEESAAGG